MKKDRTYRVQLFLLVTGWDIIGATCGCPAGQGPAATCKHIGALCYLFQNFCEVGSIPEFFTCTQRLQEWNKPRGKKLNLNPITVVDIKEHKIDANAVYLNRRESSRTPNNLDPRPLSLRFTDTKALDNLRADLLNMSHPCAFTKILVPCSKRALHDHTYCKLHKDNDSSEPAYNLIPISPPQYNKFKERCAVVMNSLQVSSKERKEIEQASRMFAMASSQTAKNNRIKVWADLRTKNNKFSSTGVLFCIVSLFALSLYP